jgi:hypothetical protein
MVRRGKDRIRVETRIVVPRREPVITARVKAEYLPDDHQIVLISRSVTEMRVTIPAEWLPADLLWNGLTLENVKSGRLLRAQARKGIAACRTVPIRRAADGRRRTLGGLPRRRMGRAGA